MKQQQPTKQSNPLILSVIGLMLVIFGVTDLYIDRVWIGIVLLAAGIAIGISGIIRYRALKAAHNKQKK